jgi:ribonuclease P protein component
LAVRQGFPQGRRLRKRRQYLAVRDQGRRLSGAHYQVAVRARPEPAGEGRSGVAERPRFGITVTRKVGDAVTRNRIKRLVREACRRIGDLFPSNADVVVTARSAAADVGAAETMAELAELARRLPRRIGGGRSGG